MAIALEAVKGLISTRDSKIHASSLMLIGIIDKLVVDSQTQATIGAIYGFYNAERKGGDGTIGYSYGGIGQMCRVLHKRGYLRKQFRSKLVTYELSKKGERVLDSLTL